MFAWESANTGDEVTPRWALPNDPYAEDVRIWCRDREIHISADIAYAVWYYWLACDDEWLRDYGAEIILSIFWMSRLEWDNREERYEIRNVIGADEYHEYVSNNAFTMVQWHLEKHSQYMTGFAKRSRAAELEKKLQITSKQRSRWQDIVNNSGFPTISQPD